MVHSRIFIPFGFGTFDRKVLLRIPMDLIRATYGHRVFNFARGALSWSLCNGPGMNEEEQDSCGPEVTAGPNQHVTIEKARLYFLSVGIYSRASFGRGKLCPRFALFYQAYNLGPNPAHGVESSA